jgi:hypothetical protein
LKELPLYWFGRVQNGGFYYLHDHHLSHLTNVPQLPLYLYDPRTVPHWTQFDPAMCLTWIQDFPVLLRTAGLGDDQCIGIEYIVQSLHTMPGAQEIPEVYTYGQMRDGGISDDGSE